MGQLTGVVQGFPPTQRIGSNRWRTNGIRVKNPPGFTTCRFSPRSKEWWVKWSVHHNKTKEESSSCRRMTSHGEIWRTRRFVFSSMWPTMQEDSLSDIGHSSGPDQKRHGTAQTLTNFADNRTESLKSWWLIFLSGHPIFRATCALERRTLTNKGGGRLSIHFCVDHDTVEVLIRIITSVNQLSICGAAADLCEELGLYQFGKPLIGTKKPSAMEKPELRVSPADFSNVSRPLLTNQPAKGNLLRDHKRTSGKPFSSWSIDKNYAAMLDS